MNCLNNLGFGHRNVLASEKFKGFKGEGGVGVVSEMFSRFSEKKS